MKKSDTYSDIIQFNYLINMIDLDILRRNPELFKKIISSGRGNPEKANIDEWIELDKTRRDLILQREELNRERNQLSELGKNDPEGARVKGKELRERAVNFDNLIGEVEKRWNEILSWIPNIPISEKVMPFGKSEEDNPIIKAWTPESKYVEGDLGYATKTSSFMPTRSTHWDMNLNTPKHHIELGEFLGIIDNEQASKVSGTRFTYLLREGALLQYAIQQLVFNELLNRGFFQIIPPLMVKERSLFGTSHFPEGRDQVYKIENEFVEDKQSLYLVGSSEPTNFSFYMDRLLNLNEMPIKMFAYTPCFRSEVGSWGRDVKGIKRVHQFDKIEMNCICTAEQSEELFYELLSVNEWLLQTLEIPYRLARKCTADAGYLASAEQIDPEAWLPGQKEFIEVGTDTNTTDYQARRMNIKYKDKDGKSRFAHTINDTGVPMGRMIIAIIDNYQQSDGSVMVPQALRSFMKKDFIGKNEI